MDQIDVRLEAGGLLGGKMEAKVAISVLAAYAGIYYLSARRLLFQLKDIDYEYFKYLGAKGGIGAPNSMAIIKMLLDGDAARADYPEKFKRQLTTVRIMLFVSPLIFLIVLFI